MLVLTLTYIRVNASTITFSLATARAGEDVDLDKFLAEAADGPWKSSGEGEDAKSSVANNLKVAGGCLF